MKRDILSKLQDELGKKVIGEPQVVYILSRIRKLLELGQSGDDDGVLKFYCNWALHTEIEDTKAVRDLLQRMIASDDKAHEEFVTFAPLHDALKGFLKNTGLTTSLYDTPKRQMQFDRLLAEIYTDTPLFLKDRATGTEARLMFIATPGKQGYCGRLEFEERFPNVGVTQPSSTSVDGLGEQS